ncbi:MAG: diaminopimelate epimerase [Chromatiaceae bacterium]|nr:diaminopimelate epimerase [Gammaproteobacteria bacterium]MCP5300487.1 diaminopimelate epimerase [Chromatiaceae bacterium]MCP5422559.1 diaminopimelate epimerase [Chromatiaceae bacterium]
MTLAFTKMHGLGNDFVVFDAVNQSVVLDETQLRAIADRRFGVGCDQILLIERPRHPDTEFFYRIYNADGGEVEQCGNGARCFARFVHDKGLSASREIPVGTAAGNIRLYLEDDDTVRVNMGRPFLDPAEIPFDAPAPASVYTIDVDGVQHEIGAVSMGNPHAVFVVDDVATAPVGALGPAVEHHARFPRRANVGFMAVRSRAAIDLRVFERGAGETLACGTGACAAVVSGRLRGLLDERVEVRLPGGTLVVSWAGDEQPVWMTGPAATVFDGTLDPAILAPR